MPSVVEKQNSGKHTWRLYVGTRRHALQRFAEVAATCSRANDGSRRWLRHQIHHVQANSSLNPVERPTCNHVRDVYSGYKCGYAFSLLEIDFNSHMLATLKAILGILGYFSYKMAHSWLEQA